MKNFHKKKYVVIPGWIVSHTDGNWHYVGAKELIELYGVKEEECIVPITGDSEIIRKIARDSNLTRLVPRPRGDYPTTVPNKANFRSTRKLL